jgi:hypothetical protein
MRIVNPWQIVFIGPRHWLGIGGMLLLVTAMTAGILIAACRGKVSPAA